jgi:tellurite resistance protein TerC
MSHPWYSWLAGRRDAGVPVGRPAVLRPRGEPSFREGAIWSIGWLLLSLLAAVVVLVLTDADGAITYMTVYFIERSLSLDNLFVFLLHFAYFGVPIEYRARMLFWGIVAALVLRGLAILGGVALIETLHLVIYVLGVLLLILAYRILRGVEENVDPDKNLVVRLVRRAFPVTGDFRGKRWFVKRRVSATPPRCSCAWRRSWRPTSRSRSTPSPPRSRSRATPS